MIYPLMKPIQLSGNLLSREMHGHWKNKRPGQTLAYANLQKLANGRVILCPWRICSWVKWRRAPRQLNPYIRTETSVHYWLWAYHANLGAFCTMSAMPRLVRHKLEYCAVGYSTPTRDWWWYHYFHAIIKAIIAIMYYAVNVRSMFIKRELGRQCRIWCD